MKKVLSLLLAMVLVVSLLPVGAMAAGDETNTTTTTTDTSTENGGTNTTTTTDTPDTNGTGTSDTGTDTNNTDTSAVASTGAAGKSTDGTPNDTMTNNGTDASGTVDNASTTTDTPNTVQANAPATLTLGSTPVSTANTEGNTKTEIDLSNLTFSNKTYDGKTSVDVDTASITKWPADAKISLSATVDDPNVGTGKKVTVTLSGPDANKYKLTGTDNLTIDIVQAQLGTPGEGESAYTVSTDTLTLYKNVQRSYDLDLLKNVSLPTGCTWGSAGKVTSCTLDGDNSGKLYANETGDEETPHQFAEGENGVKNKLTINGDLDHVSSDKGYLIFKVVSQNYLTFSIKVPITVAELTHTVKFDANVPEGDANPVQGTMSEQTGVPYNVATKLTENAFTRTNYTFKGWTTNEEGVAISEDKITITKTAPAIVTLCAQWEPTTDNQPGVPTVGDLLLDGATANVYAEGDTDVALTVGLDSSSDHTTITLSGNDVDGYTATVTFDQAFWDSIQDDLSDKLCAKFANTDRAGGSWYPESTADYPIPQTLTYTYSSNVGGLPSTGDDDSHSSPWAASKENKQIGIRMYQHFTVTYTMDTATAPSSAGSTQTSTVKKGGDLPAYKGTTSGVEGNTFLGWYIESDKVDPMPETVTQDYSFTGKWRKNTFTIQFESGTTDATGTTAPMTVTWGDPDAKLPQCGFQRSGYRFTGWMQTGNPEAVTCPAGTSAGKLGSSDKEKIIMVAQWEKAVDHVDFTLSGYDIGKAANQSKATTQTGHVNFGKTYRTDFWISTKEDGSNVLTTDQFAVDTTYYLFVNFTLEEGYADGGLTRDTVCLNGKAAISLSKPTEITDDSPNARAGAGVITYYTAGFQLPTIRKITLEVGKNGSVEVTGATNSGDAGVYYAMDGDKVTFKVTPNSGYVCSAFKVDGKSQSSHTLTVSKSHTVKVQFAKESKRDTSNPKTGDGIFLPTTAMLLSAMAICAIAPRKKRR